MHPSVFELVCLLEDRVGDGQLVLGTVRAASVHWSCTFQSHGVLGRSARRNDRLQLMH